VNNNEINKAIDIVKQISDSQNINYDDIQKITTDKNIMEKVKKIDEKYGKEIKKIEEMKNDMTADEKAELILKLKKSMNREQKAKFNQIIESLNS
jgi:NCAIR mutase (PurE)-related protein